MAMPARTPSAFRGLRDPSPPSRLSPFSHFEAKSFSHATRRASLQL